MGIDEAAGKLPADGELGGTAQPAPVQAAILPPCLEKSRYICHRAQAERWDSEVYGGMSELL